MFIRSHFAGGEHAPIYAHYPGSQADCPSDQGVNLQSGNARAHHWMCDAIAELISKDLRCALVTVDTYQWPAIEKRGRHPDV